MVKKLLLFLLLLAFISNSRSQGTGGKDFWVAYMDIRPDLVTDTPHFRTKDSAELYISSMYAAKVTITMKAETYFSSGIAADYTKSVTLSPNKPYFLQLPPGVTSKTWFSDNITNNGLHVTSDSLIHVYGINRFPGSRAAAMVIPTESIPASPEYLVSCNEGSHPGGFIGAGGPKNSFSDGFLIVGISPVSKIEIIPKSGSTVRNNTPGIPFVITLQQGQTFLYMSPKEDLTGSVIRSRDKNTKFAVFAGNRAALSKQLNSSGVLCSSGDDHAFEQMLPIVTWGDSYTALPFKNSKGGYYLKIVAAEDFTRISIDGSYRQTLNHGEYMVYNVAVDSVTRITADKYFSVTQFGKGYYCNQHTVPKINMGDVSEMTLVPDKQNLNTRAVVSPLTHYYFWYPKTHIKAPEYYINVLVKTSDTGQFKHNGKGIPVSQWKSSPMMPGSSYATLDMDTVLNNTVYNPNGLIAYTYGYSEFEGYASMSSASFKAYNNHFIFDDHCLFDTAKFFAVKNDSFSNYSWDLGDNSGIKTGTSASTIYNDTGWFKVVMYSKHVRTNAIDSVSKYIYVPDINKIPILGKDTMVCGKFNFPLVASNFNMDNTYLWYDGHPNYYHNINKAGKFSLKVTERSGCSYRDTITVTNFPFPYADFRTADTSICLNKNRAVTYSNLSTTPDSIISNKWNFGDTTLIDNGYSVKHFFTKPGKYNVKLTVRSVHGCEDDTVRALNIIPSPDAQFSINGIDSCLNNNHVDLVNTSVIDTSLHKNYKWFFSEGFVLFNQNPGTWNYAQPGKYSILLVYANKYNCVDSFNRDVTIYSHPKTAFGFAKTFQCANDSVQFINKTTSANNPVSSKWSFGDNTSDTATNPLHLYPLKGAYTVKLVSASPQGCKDSLAQALKVYDAPKADFSINDTLQCLSGNSFLFSNLSTTDSGGLIANTWLFDDTIGALNTDNPSKSFKTSGRHFIQLKVPNLFGCSDSISKSVFVKKGPDVVFNINDPSQCLNGNSFDLSYVPVPANGTITAMKWYYKTDSALNVNSVSNISYPAYGSYPVSLKLFDTDGCSNERIRNLFVNPEPVAAIGISFPAQCLNTNSFSFTDLSTIPAGNLAGFNWNFGDLTSSIVQNPAGKIYTTAGKFNIRMIVSSDSGCVDTANSSVEVYPNASISILPVSRVCLNDSSVFGATVSLSSGSITSYLWDFGDMQTSPDLNTRHRYTNPGTYNITLTTRTDKNCTDTKTASNWVIVHALPVPMFTHRTKDGGDKNTIISFFDITTPKPRSLLWDFEKFGKAIRDTSFSVSDSTTFRTRLYVTDQNGCTGMREEYIFVSPPQEVFFPSAFSPNGDGHNDGFGPAGVLFASNYTFRIFNRWGELLFQTETPGETWDGTYQGKTVPNGVYHYHVELNDYNGLYKKYDGTLLLMW